MSATRSGADCISGSSSFIFLGFCLGSDTAPAMVAKDGSLQCGQVNANGSFESSGMAAGYPPRQDVAGLFSVICPLIQRSLVSDCPLAAECGGDTKKLVASSKAPKVASLGITHPGPWPVVLGQSADHGSLWPVRNVRVLCCG